MQILVIGSGGREHALVWKIAQSPKVDKIYCAPGNAGTAQYAENVGIKVEDIAGGIHLSQRREAGSRFTSKAIAVSTAPDGTHSEHSEYSESEFRSKNEEQRGETT